MKTRILIVTVVVLAGFFWVAEARASARLRAAEPAVVQSYDRSGATVDVSKFDTVDEVVDAVYTTISFGRGGECNWTGLRELFMPGAIFLQPSRPGTLRKTRSLDAFCEDTLKFIRESEAAKTQGFSERIVRRRTTRFGDVATCHVIFELRFDPQSLEPVARGLDSIQLVYGEGRWWVASIATEHESPDQILPPKLLGD